MRQRFIYCVQGSSHGMVLPYHPLQSDSRRRQDGWRVQVDHHISQLPLDVTMIHSLHGGSAVYWYQRKGKEVE